MNSPAYDIKDMLEADSTVDSTGYPIYITKEPSTPVEVTTIYDTGGYAPQLTYDKDEIYEFPSVQIKIRTTDFLDGWSVISAIKDSLHGRAHETWNSTYYSVIRCLNGPFVLDVDDQQRIHLVVNFNLQRR